MGVLIDDRQLAMLQRSIDDDGDDGGAGPSSSGAGPSSYKPHSAGGAGPSSYKPNKPKAAGGGGRFGGAAAAAAAASVSSCGGDGDSTGRALARQSVANPHPHLYRS